MSLSLPWRVAGVKEVGPGQVFWSPWAQTSLMGLRPAAHILQATQLKVPSPPSAPLDLAGAAGKYGGFQDFEDERSVIFSPVPTQPRNPRPSHVGASTAHREQNRASPPKCVSPVQGRARRVAIGVDRLQAPAGARRWHACWRRAGHSTELVRGAAQSRHLSVQASLASPALGRNWRKWPRGAWRLQT